MIWFVADWHFGDTGILAHQPERKEEFGGIDEMDDWLITEANHVVKRSDELFFLGDFCWKASRAGHYRQRLKVRRFHVCFGNHDAASLVNHTSMSGLMLFRKFQGNHFHLSHYPIFSWNRMYSGGYHLYGHGHGKYEKQLDLMCSIRRAMDVGVDNIHRLTGAWRPISLDEVLERLN